ncbi:hypothetical protein DE146DRAFT_603464 [Phaeosphaeria sp. MPI-PUGE-AT-0046c]|nr:hypothetical protein DE146DRAFT_603464 [Phaeosphaeria sp. MPI-PUGE-AT-0046c]
MKTSKYAPKTAAETLANSRVEKSKAEKEKATRLLGRLQWKAEILMLCYYKARDIVQAADARQSGHSGLDPISVSAREKQAESMFKVDFFEFYTLLERYITVCLGVLGVTVSGAAPQTNFNALRYYTNPDLHKTRPMASHAFHANLLEALDDEKCPLHDSFGKHPVRAELGLAKEFRNTWKDADERIIGSKRDQLSDNPRQNITLHDSQLEGMLRILLAGCEHAHGVVQQHSTAQTNSNGFSNRDFELQPHEYGTPAAEDTPLEYMDDAMELD